MRVLLLSMAVLCASGADRCSALRESTGYEYSVVTAVAMPDHCRVTGLIQPEVRFEVDLPAQWNGKLLVVGNGGYAGEPMESQARAGQRSRALSRGFAFAFTNTGHEAAGEPLGAFALNPQKLVDYAFRAIHVTTLTAKTLARVYYGRPAERSYYEGCSTGGRQGLIAAQRFPQDFDGIIAGAPVLNFTGTMVSYARMLSALRTAPIPTAKVKVLAERVLQACDARDGVKDGVIDDPRRCEFSPRRDLTVCGNDGADCFTSAQIAAMETVYTPVTLSGKPWFPG